MNLYEIDAAITACIDPETGELIDEAALVSLQMERADKIRNVALWVKNLNASVVALKAERDAFDERLKAAQKKADALQRIKQPSIIIDDATYLMTNEFMRTARISGYQKFTDMALNYYTLVRRAAALPEDKIVYFIGHSETDDKGNEKFKTVGKLLDEKVTLEGLYTIVLKTVVQDGHYFFATHNSGRDTVKSPLGMFEDDLIPNDLAAVDKIIREYYGMTKETAHG